MEKIIICGGRDFTNYSILEYVVDKVICNSRVEIVSGHAQGTDTLGELYAKNHGLPIKVFPADWTKYGKSAGPIRNKQMVDYIKDNKDNKVVAFVGPNSIGTKNTISLARKNGIDVIQVDYNIEDESLEDICEGIRVDSEGNVIFDFDCDEPSDIIKLTKTSINLSKFNKKLWYYGFKVYKNTEKKDRETVLRTIKSANSETDRMIEQMLNSFYEKSEIKNFNYVISIPSKSKTNEKIKEILSMKYEDIESVSCEKLPTTELSINFNLVKKLFKYEDLSKVIEYLNGIITYCKKENDFRISKIKPQYRKYFNSMIKFDDSSIKNKEDTSLLIIDDIITTGSSLSMVLSRLEEVGYLGNITILTLINNK